MSWEDRVTDAQYQKIEAAVTKFQSGRKTRDDEHALYDALTNNGMSPEEADEYINLITESY